jgi:SAM-dependent methyltransferase
VQRSAPSRYAPNHDEALAALGGAANYNGWLFSRAAAHLGSSVLDAGAGLGIFTEMAAEKCDDVVAVEPDPAFGDFLQQRFADRPWVQIVRTDLLDVAAELDRKVDSVICFNVLEHIPDDRRALAAIHDVLAPGGRLLLLVPAHEFLMSPFDRTVGHLRRYAKPQLDRLLREAGFDLPEARYVNPVGGIGWFVSLRLMRRSAAPVGHVAVFDRLVPLVRPLDRLHLPFGQSLWYVARRSQVGNNET